MSNPSLIYDPTAAARHRNAIEETVLEEGVRLAELRRLALVLQEVGLRLGPRETSDEGFDQHLSGILRPTG
ncbi:hypothetical protein [Methylobacterium nigriterrae]|uniref:hypothetical protein n=1 Tax=Methylobacterium nigriterrae TaxID=3127512 RepID=UPI003014072A